MSMMNLDAGFVSAIVGGMVVAFAWPMAVSFAMCRAWRKFKLRSNIAKWLGVLAVLLVCMALSYAVFPLFTMFVAVAFPLIFFGCYAGRNLAR
jgi:hypothetical protein